MLLVSREHSRPARRRIGISNHPPGPSRDVSALCLCVRRSARPVAASRSTPEPPRDETRAHRRRRSATRRPGTACEVHIRIQRRAETLHQCCDAGLAGGAGEASLAAEVVRDRPVHHAEHQRQCVRISRQQEPQRVGSENTHCLNGRSGNTSPANSAAVSAMHPLPIELALKMPIFMGLTLIRESRLPRKLPRHVGASLCLKFDLRSRDCLRNAWQQTECR
jgi:hypothetical protein